MIAPQILEKLPIDGVDWCRIDIRTALENRAPKQKYIVGGLPEEKGIYGMLIGPDGARKSWVAAQICVGVATGTEIAGGLWEAPAKGRVVFFTAEDSADSIWRRLEALQRNVPDAVLEIWKEDLQHNLDIIPLASGESGLTLITQDSNGQPARHPHLPKLIQLCQGARLVVLDPLADLLDAEENDGKAARLLVQVLRGISRETGAGVLIVHHQNKAAMGSGDKGNQSARGSSKIPAGCRWSVTLQPISEKEAARLEMTDAHLWTKIHEGKSQYRPPKNMDEDDMALYHYPTVADRDGRLHGGTPLLTALPKLPKSSADKWEKAEKKWAADADAYAEKSGRGVTAPRAGKKGGGQKEEIGDDW